MNHKLLAAKLLVTFGGVTLGFVEEINLMLRTFGLLVSVIVGLLTIVKLYFDIKKHFTK